MSDAQDRSTARRALIVIGLVLVTLVGLALVWAARRVLIWTLVAAFFAVALKPLVDRLQRGLVRRRALATLLVFLAAFVLLGALVAVIVLPLAGEVGRFADRAPELVREARAGRGPVGELLTRFRLRDYANTHAEQLQRYGSRLGQPAVGVVRGVVQTVAGVVTVIVLAYLMVLEAPKIIAGALALVGDGGAERLRRIGRDSARTITGYLSGNLLISLICGGLTFLVLFLTGVPFAAVIALLVAIADLIPLVGATLGAIIAAGAGFAHSPTAGVIVLVFFVVYQQAENHLLQPVIMSRAVRLNPLTVLVSVLVAAELAGLLGALLAIPAAGIAQILLREFAPKGLRTVPSPATGAAEPAGGAGRQDGSTSRPAPSRGGPDQPPAGGRAPETGGAAPPAGG
ncbi:AI-2E family transporter [Micromonospora sp. 4G57]|uniref:AI-2E family transporter n=1 Tax=Micromonospora sicca TaxID=2202420 RepID=A0ABU5JHW0_9ACTN|nr:MULTISPECIES: AI-2E family transporter [unclassified Micromonospora]MDZ5447515.1 AI-2E family transporter [Micromonospora sp. 4G57]MDZ5492014.1 AI-2E family transporter [Micromonospora sp. 4G53]